MFLAHLPTGYLISRVVDRTGSRAVLLAALFGSVLPDVDMLGFFFVDGGRVHHHRYWTHVPLFWAALAVPAAFVTSRARVPTIAFFLGITSHLALDTIVGDIQWMQPFSDRFVHLVTVPRRTGHWVWSFLLHWTFVFELVLLGVAAFVATCRVRARCVSHVPLAVSERIVDPKRARFDLATDVWARPLASPRTNGGAHESRPLL